LWTVWFTYGAFYFCRTNVSAAVPGLKESVEAGGLGLSAVQVSYFLIGFKIAYAAGQLLNGQFSEQLAPQTAGHWNDRNRFAECSVRVRSGFVFSDLHLGV
jgi:sugar phosphate permease